MTLIYSVRARILAAIFPFLAMAAMLPIAAEAHHDQHWNNDEPTCWIKASPSHVYDSSGAELTWDSTNAYTATLTDFGSVSTGGSRHIYPSGNRTYTLTVSGYSGKTATCDVRVTSTNTGSAPTCSISLSYPYYDGSYYNRAATLTWHSYGSVDSTSISGIGSVSSSGSQAVYPSTNQVYTMTVSGPYGSNTCQTTGYTGTPYPSCTLKNSPDIVIPGGSAVLSWTTNGNIRSATLTDVGSVSSNGGNTTVYPGTSRTYTLTVQDYAGNTSSCSTYLAVSGSVSTGYPTTPTYTYPLPSVTPTAYITLNAIPYTGLELGVMGTIAYYLALATLLVAIGYGVRVGLARVRI